MAIFPMASQSIMEDLPILVEEEQVEMVEIQDLVIVVYLEALVEEVVF